MKKTAILLMVLVTWAWTFSGCEDKADSGWIDGDAATDGDSDTGSDGDVTPEQEAESQAESEENSELTDGDTMDNPAETEQDASPGEGEENQPDGDLDQEQAPELEADATENEETPSELDLPAESGENLEQESAPESEIPDETDLTENPETSEGAENESDGEGGAKTPGIKSFNHSDCLNNTKNGGDEESDQAEKIDVEVDATTGNVTISHLNAYFNCCVDSIDATLEITGTTIKLFEKETTTNPCNCICPYSLQTVVENLTAGDYTLEVYTNGTLAGTKSFKVEARLAEVKRSDCLAAGTKTAEYPPSFSAEYDAATGVIHALHHNAPFNCCLDSVAIALKRTDFVVELTETEVASNPCFCTCPYDVTADIAGLGPGHYTVNFLVGEALQGSAEVVVPGK